MIPLPFTLPAWLNLRTIGAVAATAALCIPTAYCTGRRDANIAAEARVKLAAEKVKSAALKASLAATAVRYAQDAKDAEELKGLRDEIDRTATEDDVGPGTAAVLDRLRRQQAASREAAR